LESAAQAQCWPPTLVLPAQDGGWGDRGGAAGHDHGEDAGSGLCGREGAAAVDASDLGSSCCGFLLNVPKEELESFERILFLLEQAHWFYEDNSVEHNPNLKSLSFKDFTSLNKPACAWMHMRLWLDWSPTPVPLR
jgi:hypothetical protein